MNVACYPPTGADAELVVVDEDLTRKTHRHDQFHPDRSTELGAWWKGMANDEEAAADAADYLVIGGKLRSAIIDNPDSPPPPRRLRGSPPRHRPAT